jgi:hypothetical protein
VSRALSFCFSYDCDSRLEIRATFKKYVLTIPYETDEELDRIIYDDILAEAHQIADLRNGFIEADVVAVDDPDRSW